jgi:hypothetical protein
MRVLRMFPASHPYPRDTERERPTQAGIRGLRQKSRHNVVTQELAPAGTGIPLGTTSPLPGSLFMETMGLLRDWICVTSEIGENRFDGGFEFLWACGPPIGMKVRF